MSTLCTTAVWASLCCAVLAQGPQPFSVEMEDATLAEAVARVAEAAPDMQYVIWRGDAERRTLSLSASNPDDLVDQIAAEFGAESTVIGDLWIIEGSGPDAWRRDLRAAIYEGVAAYPEIDGALRRRKAQGREAPSLGDLYRGMFADLKVPAGLAPDRCRCIGVEVAPDEPGYADLYAAALDTSAREAEVAAKLARGRWGIALEGDVLSLLCLDGNEPTVAKRVPVEAPPERPDALTRFGPATTYTHPGRGWPPTNPLGTPVSLERGVRFSELLQDLGARAGVRLQLAGPEFDGPLAIRVRDLPIGTVLAAVSAASATPVDDFEPSRFPTFEPAESHVFGAECGRMFRFATTPIDDRISRFCTPAEDIVESVSGLTEEEREVLRSGPVDIELLAPRIRHTVWRWRFSAVPAFRTTTDFLLAQVGTAVPLLILVSGNGDVRVDMRTRQTGSWRAHVGRLGAGGLGRTGEQPLVDTNAASVRWRTAHAYGPRPRDLRTELLYGRTEWVRRSGPVARPRSEGGDAANEAQAGQ